MIDESFLYIIIGVISELALTQAAWLEKVEVYILENLGS